jgi:hypothetical protein
VTDPNMLRLKNNGATDTLEDGDIQAGDDFSYDE